MLLGELAVGGQMGSESASGPQRRTERQASQSDNSPPVMKVAFATSISSRKRKSKAASSIQRPEGHTGSSERTESSGLGVGGNHSWQTCLRIER